MHSMIEKNEALMALLEEGRKKGYVAVKKVLSIIEEDSEEFDEISKTLEHEGIDMVRDNDIEDYVVPSVEIDIEKFEEEEFDDFTEDDKEFSEFSSEVENDLKNKDIDDIVSYVVSPAQSDDPIKMYLKEIGQISLLTTVRELELSRTVQEGLLAEDYLKSVQKNNKEISDEERLRMDNLILDGQDARAILIESNLRLVVSIAKRYLGRGMQFQDLIQEGNMGLMKAVNKFDPTKGFKFSTYATWWIRQSITRAIADQARTIRIPVHMVETINKLVRTQRKLTQELRREPTPEEIAAELKISVERVQQIQKIAQEPVALETPVGEEDDSTLGDFVHDQETLNPLDYTIYEKFKEEIDTVLRTLTPREEKVLRLRFGLTDGKPHTLEEVGKEFGVTRERIRQIEAKAIRRLRHPTRQKRLSQYK